MAKKYTVRDKENDMTKIFEALHKKDENGKMKLDDLIVDMDTCPFCGTEGEKLPDGTKARQLIVDKETLTWHTNNCCSSSGGVINFCMLTRKMNFENAIKWLKQFLGV